MLTVETRHAIHPETARSFDTEALRRHFLLGGLFRDDEARLVYTHYDRMIVGGVVPKDAAITLDAVKECGTSSILDRREMVVVNIGGPGRVHADAGYAMGRGDMLYLGLGAGPVTFEGEGRFYVISAPAHEKHPSRLVRIEDAAKVALGARETSNERVINQFVHPDVMPSCQLVVGMTQLAPGSVWNTMPAHVHDRRMEAYLYIDLDASARVFHMMGEPSQTRSMVIANEEGALSPPWSIHCGAGTSNYTFIWAMAGDNVDYRDVEMVAMETLR
jgi:4-deoxy-L-threo-5-hexosulose-uronate ketol-isomerase